MMEFMKPIAIMIDGAFVNGAAEAIGVATENFGSAITSIAAMKMMMVPMPCVHDKCHTPRACEMNARARVIMDGGGSTEGKGRAHGVRASGFV